MFKAYANLTTSMHKTHKLIYTTELSKIQEYNTLTNQNIKSKNIPKQYQT